MNHSPANRDLKRRSSLAREDTSSRRSDVYQAAVRHSRRVYFLRRVLPFVAGGLLLLAALWIWIDPLSFTRDVSVQVGALKISGTKLTMEAPKLTGFSKDGHPFNITAESAAQDLTKTNLIELSNVAGVFDLGDLGNTRILSKSGVYDSKTEQLRLFDGINVSSTRGYTGKFIDAVSEPKKGHMVSENPVEIVFTDGNLRANRMEIFDQGISIVFEAGVVVNLKNMEQPKPAPGERIGAEK